MRNTHRLLFLPLAAASLASGCFVVEDGPLNALERDGGDLSLTATSETCDESGAFVVTESGNYDVSTAGASNDLNMMLCGSGSASPGPDRFLKVDVESGQYWHFHVKRAQGETAGADPVLGIFELNAGNTACVNTADCTYVSNRCGQNVDEHFGVQFSKSGIWAIAIDDANAANAGARFSIAVFRPICGNGSLEHGEGCDFGDTVSGDGCDSKCRVEIDASAFEVEPNDDRFWANHVLLTTGAPGVRVDGTAINVCDTDTFVVSIPANKSLHVRALDGSGNCRPHANLPFTFNGRTAAGTSIQPMTAEAGTGCAILDRLGGASDTEYFVTVDGSPSGDTPTNYVLEFSIP